MASGSRSRGRDWASEPLTAKASKTKQAVDALKCEVWECRSAGPPDPQTGFQKKGAGPPTQKYVASFFVGLDDAEREKLVDVLRENVKHGKTSHQGPYTQDSKFPGGPPLTKPSKVTKERDLLVQWSQRRSQCRQRLHEKTSPDLRCKDHGS